MERWLGDEHIYERAKFAPQIDDAKTLGAPERWDETIEMYLHRARVLGLDNPAGRQAIAKAAVTCIGYLESVVRVHGPLPEPGVPSGYNTDQLRPVPDEQEA